MGMGFFVLAGYFSSEHGLTGRTSDRVYWAACIHWLAISFDAAAQYVVTVHNVRVWLRKMITGESSAQELKKKRSSVSRDASLSQSSRFLEQHVVQQRSRNGNGAGEDGGEKAAVRKPPHADAFLAWPQ